MGGLIKSFIWTLKRLAMSLRGGGSVRWGRGVSLHPSVKMAVGKGGTLTFSDRCVAAAQGLLLVERGASLTMGEHVSLSRGVQIVCHDRVEIGAETMLANNVMLFDHDHDYRAPGGLADRLYKKSPIVIGKNVWIGAGTVILRGTTIGDNTVVGAGCVLKGDYPPDSLVVQRRETEVRPLKGDER